MHPLLQIFKIFIGEDGFFVEKNIVVHQLLLHLHFYNYFMQHVHSLFTLFINFW